MSNGQRDFVNIRDFSVGLNQPKFSSIIPFT